MAAGRRGFDVAVLDMQMPDMDGVMLAREIRTLPGGDKLPLILLSSLGQREVTSEKKLFNAAADQAGEAVPAVRSAGRDLQGS
jgi:CheY-like chemotaxis protein